MDFHHRLRDGFLKISESEPARVKILDGMNPEEIIHEEIIEILREEGFLND